MNASLDFVSRARHAWTEFRQPSKFDNSPQAQQAHAEAGDSRYEPSELFQPNSQLTDFRLLVGIWQDKSFTSKHGFQMNRRPQASLADRPSPNLGIYATVCDCEIKAKRNYKSSSRLINFCYGLQIVVAAALTALGAAAASNKAVTAFGAVNTCIAGFLTYLKGSGLPHRIKYFQHEWGKIREYIEQRERDFAFPGNGLNVSEEVEKIRQMYENLRMDIENNRPDRFVSSGNLARAAPQTISLARPQLSTSTMSKNWNEKENEVSDTIERARSTATGLFSNARGMKDMLEDKLKELKALEHEIVSSGKQMATEKRKNADDQIRATAMDVEHAGERLAQDARAAVDARYTEGKNRVEHARDQLEQSARAAVDERYTEGRNRVEHTGERLEQNARAAVEEKYTEGRNLVGGAIERTQEDAHAAITRQGDALKGALGSQNEQAPPK